MSIPLSDDDKAFTEEVRAWFEANVPDHIRGDAFMFGTMTPQDNVEWNRLLNQRGWAAPAWPAEYGGPGWGPLRRYLFDAMRAQTGAPVVWSLGINLLGPVIYTFGTDAQKAYYLPRILNFDDWWCQGYSEPGAGSDLASLKTRAVADGDHYIINGSKIWTTYAHEADMMFCLVRTSTEERKQQGISFILVDMATPGVEVRPIRSIDGRHHLNEVFLTDVRVPRANLVGEEGQGWSIAKYLLTHERTNIARIPMSRMSLARLKSLAAGSAGEGRIADQENLATRISELGIDLDCLEFINTQMLMEAETGGAPGNLESSLLKIKGTEIQQRLAELRLEVGAYASWQWQGDESGAELDADERALLRAATEYNFSRASTIYGGSNEVQYNVMAKAFLGL